MADSYRQVTAPLIGKGRVKGSFIPTLQRCQNIKCQMSISASPLSNVVLFRLWLKLAPTVKLCDVARQ